MNDVQALAEKTGVANVANERSAAQALLAEDALQLGLEDMDVKRQVMLAAQVIERLKIVVRHPLGGRARYGGPEASPRS